MSSRPEQHITGDRGELHAQLAFVDAGYACNPIPKDYGEDFFVVTHAIEGTIEPSRIFVQSRATDPSETAETRWIEYVDPLTVRNWLLGNEMVVVVKRDLRTKAVRYCIPEERHSYPEIFDYLFGAKKARKFPIKCDLEFTGETAAQLVWRARLRHYDRLIRLSLPFQQSPGALSQAEAFAMELAFRLGLLAEPLKPSKDSIEILDHLSRPNGFPDDWDQPLESQSRFIACKRITIDALAQRAPKFPMFVTSVDLVALALCQAYADHELG